MSDQDRLDAVLARLRAPPPVACEAHAARVAAFAEPDTPLDLDALATVVDCPACANVLQAHPVLHPAGLDLPVPPPVVPPAARRIPWRPLALAATLLLFTWAALHLAAPAPTTMVDTRPGPVAEGHASYGFVVLPGPYLDDRPSYTWVERPADAEDYRFRSLDPGPVALNHRYDPWTWR